MKNILCKPIILLLLWQPFLFFCAQAQPSPPKTASVPRHQAADYMDPASYIDPTIGNIAQLLEPTRPTADLPNQLIRVYPIRKDYADDRISSFPLTAVSHRLGEVFSLKPSGRPVAASSWNERMPYDQGLEITRPWYYSTYLLDEGITVEFTPGKKTGCYRFSFPEGSDPAILLNMYGKGGSTWHFLSGREVEGVETWQSRNKNLYVWPF